MNSITGRITASAERYGISRPLELCITLFPYLITVIFAAALTIPATRQFAKGQLTENQPIELLTALFLLMTSVVAFLLMRRQKRRGARLHVVAFYAFVGVAVFVVGMEEIAWGQWILGFETPQGMKEINQQNELTIHNIEGLHGRSEFLRLFFGIGGLLGVWLARFQPFRKITPPFFLVGWFLLITLLTIPDLWNDYGGISANIDALFNFLSELNEFLIATVSFLFVWFNLKHVESSPTQIERPS